MIDQLKYLNSRTAMYLLASEYIGLTEIPGERNNPQILTFFQDIGHSWVQADSVAWCGAFINYVALKCGCERSFKLTGRSWLEKGIEMQDPKLGDIVIFWREKKDSWKGHVGLYAGQDDKYIHCLGGNQSNQVNIKPYPKSKVLGFRRIPYLI